MRLDWWAKVTRGSLLSTWPSSIRDSEAKMSGWVAGPVRQVVDEVSTHRPVSPSPMETPSATYRVLYSLISSAQLGAL